MRPLCAIVLAAVLTAAAPPKGCGGPVIDPANFVDRVDNPYFPLVPGTTFNYRARTDEGLETIEVAVTRKTKVILGIPCVVVRDTVRLDGQIIELTYDWYAQDKLGNVWYFGEDSTEYENGKPANKHGSWEAGVDGAEPGILMLACPHPGISYRQEYYEGEAEDMAQVLRLDASVSVPYGKFEDCLKTKEWTPLEPGVVEHKFYAKGVGKVFGKNPDTGKKTELLSITP